MDGRLLPVLYAALEERGSGGVVLVEFGDLSRPEFGKQFVQRPSGKRESFASGRPEAFRLHEFHDSRRLAVLVPNVVHKVRVPGFPNGSEVVDFSAYFLARGFGSHTVKFTDTVFSVGAR